jgi:RND family efflux transporter MFP subunit
LENIMKVTSKKPMKLVILTSFFCSITVLSASTVANESMAKATHDHSKEISTQEVGGEHGHENEIPLGNSGHNHKGNSKDNNIDGSENVLEEKHGKGITFSPEKMALANIKVSTLTAKVFAKSVYAPGEIKANGYTSYIVSPRTESVVISRHAILGEHVTKGQALVTLFSESMAEAQAQYRVAYSEWQRTKKLGRGTVSESRLLASETDYISAYGRLTAFGLTKVAIQDIVKNNSSNLGEYTLVAQRSGVVLSDDFAQGQRLPAGEKVMVLADEKDLWIEARVSPTKKLSLPNGTMAKIEFSGQIHDAKVIQEAHTIDPITRTRIVRLSVENTDDTLHSGMFVNVNFQFDTETPVIAVPETALMRGSDGDWTVFVEGHPGEFKSVEIELGQPLGDYREIIGIAPKTRVVTTGAFFVASEIAKGGFDPHNH